MIMFVIVLLLENIQMSKFLMQLQMLDATDKKKIPLNASVNIDDSMLLIIIIIKLLIHLLMIIVIRCELWDWSLLWIVPLPLHVHN